MPGAGRRRIVPDRGLASLPQPRRATSSSTSRATRSRSTTASSTCSASSTIDGDASTSIWSRDATGDVTLDGERRAFERLVDLLIDRLDARPGDARLPLRAVRADGAERLMGRYATREDGGRPPAAGRRPRRPVRVVRQGFGRASRATRSSGSSRSTASCARSTCGRRLEHRRVRAWLEVGEGERPAGEHCADRGLQPRRRRQQLAAARLAGRAARGARAADSAEPCRGRRPGTPQKPGRADRAPAAVAGAGRSPRGRCRPGGSGRRTPESRRRWLLAQLLGWHRREDKASGGGSTTHGLTDEELVDEREPLGRLEPSRDRGRRRGQADVALPISGPGSRPQAAATVIDPATARGMTGTTSPCDWAVDEVVAVDPAARPSTCKRPRREPHPRGADPARRLLDDAQQRARSAELGEWVVENGLDGAGPSGRRATCCCAAAAGRPGAGEPLRGAGRDRARCGASPRLGARPRRRSPSRVRPARARPTPGRG